MMKRYEFDVAVSLHPLSKHGLYKEIRNIEILAENHTEAFLTAYAMASYPNNVITDIWDRI